MKEVTPESFQSSVQKSDRNRKTIRPEVGSGDLLNELKGGTKEDN